MMSHLVFQAHWLLGLSAGFVLAIMGVTGALLSFEDEIVTALSRSSVPAQAAGTPLSPDALVAHIRAQRPDAAIVQLRFSSSRRHAVEVRLQESDDPAEKNAVTYVDPISGKILGRSVGSGFFGWVEALHRFLAFPAGEGEKDSAVGRHITGFSTIALIFFAASGLYLRWPREPLNWRSWLVLNLNRTGRNLHREIHAVVGGWLLVCYLLSALTGLTWSYEWYRQALNTALGGQERSHTGETASDKSREGGGPQQERRKNFASSFPAASLDAIWATFRELAPRDFGWAGITMPGGAVPVLVERPLSGGFHDGISDRFLFDAHTGVLIGKDLAADRPLGTKIAESTLTFHSGAFLGMPGRVIIMLSSLAMPLFLVTGVTLYLSRRAKARTGVEVRPSPLIGADMTSPLVVTYASQTGASRRLAEMTAGALAAIGQPVRLLPLAQLDAAGLRAARSALFVVSTYGEGQPPDAAKRFVREVMAEPASLITLDFGLLALGDKEYPDFCRFGREVEAWLLASGARPLFSRIERDGDDVAAERLWAERISAIGARVEPGAWHVEPFQSWLLLERHLLNVGSEGGPVFHLRLIPRDGLLPRWRSGDVAEVRPRNEVRAVAAFLAAAGLDGAAQINGTPLSRHLAVAVLPVPGPRLRADLTQLVASLRPLPHRSYTIASTWHDGALELLVRQVVKPDGLGLASGWLTEDLQIGGTVGLRIRSNPDFHRPDTGPLILIGNGTGLAGLRAHVKESRREGSGGHWLLFGERSARRDAYFKEELAGWMADGTLARLDLAWSRDSGTPRYVQHLVEPAGDTIRRWADAGAAIMVCGSLGGMAPAVEGALRVILGEAGLEALRAEGRYRRDVY